jgi:transcriptional regulator with XRE-family HTH domain
MLRVKEIAKEKGISIKEIASRIGITSPALSQNIAGRASVDRLKEIADILGVEIRDLFQSDGTFGIIRHKDKTFEINSIIDIEDVLKKIREKKSGSEYEN